MSDGQGFGNTAPVATVSRGKVSSLSVTAATCHKYLCQKGDGKGLSIGVELAEGERKVFELHVCQATTERLPLLLFWSPSKRRSGYPTTYRAIYRFSPDIYGRNKVYAKN